MVTQAIICDLDGTLVSSEWRSELYFSGQHHEHNVGIPFDQPIDRVLKTLQTAYLSKIHVHYMTGRPERYRMQTLSVFHKHNFPPGSLWMRPIGMQVKNSEVKKYLYESYVAPLNHEILFAIDDNEHVPKMWAELNIKCLKVKDPKIDPKIFRGVI